MSNKYYFIKARHPQMGLNIGFDNYICTNEDFKRFCNDVFDLEHDKEYDPVFSRFVRQVESVVKVEETESEDRTIEGIQKMVETSKGNVKIGYTRVRENRIYVQVGEIYLRGYKIFTADLCLVNAMDFIPLDKSKGNGNVEIIEWNKRKATKGIKFIHNKIENILYLVDMLFQTYEAMREDVENPTELNLTFFIEPLI
ncbi:hypothetical protein [Sinanaerobacter sp. ZZT-01]|uniref:hypothetical protein n=1 Tax=Sinanaerobacter sp. ZZT-01 TaxID=3111540 RepID=UPI002D76AB24|nr:hypothetical protein [Sinanaerobacter sp. ZZT-01]WRR92750.1 hypothetical protein U5921_11935 [Sinanaerobacter sp. ZZT-01]